ncbi:MAG TPA: Hpt domain-containing protein [Pirellulales bacterium]|nr:Hpt domain-containing protein [Pirellulales bacterium]
MTHLLDTNVYYSRLAADPLLADIVAMYVAEMPDRIAALVQRWKARDAQGLATLAHQLKGAAGSHGFDQLTPYAARLEGAARGAAAESEMQEALDALVQACRRVRL